MGAIINGINNTSTFGAYPTVTSEQLNLTSEQAALYNISTTVGEFTPMLSPGGRSGEAPVFAPVSGNPIIVIPGMNALAIKEGKRLGKVFRTKNRICKM